MQNFSLYEQIIKFLSQQLLHDILKKQEITLA